MTTSPATRKIVRDKSWVEREYNGDKYPPLLEAARAAVNQGAQGLAPRYAAVYRAQRGPFKVLDERRFVVNGKETALPVAFAQGGVQGFVTHILGEACTPATHAVIELGAGWGRNLFAALLQGAISETTRLYALEFASTAREAAHLVAQGNPALAFEALAFDYHAPDYSGIEASTSPSVLLTVHSIEQIPQLRRDVFTDLIKRLPNLTGLHLEPIGWQIPTARSNTRRRLSTAAYAERNDYNHNFWPVLEGLEHDGLIEITHVAPELLGANVENPSSFISWRTRS